MNSKIKEERHLDKTLVDCSFETGAATGSIRTQWNLFCVSSGRRWFKTLDAYVGKMRPADVAHVAAQCIAPRTAHEVGAGGSPKDVDG